MNIRKFNTDDIDKVISIYMNYFNNIEGDSWTKETVRKRLSQIINREDYFGLAILMEDKIVGFVLGGFEQFFDGKIFHIIEIFIDYNYQNKGLGQTLMEKLEQEVKKMGAFRVILEAVDDEKRNKFYNKMGYQNCNNLIIKGKNI